MNYDKEVAGEYARLRALIGQRQPYEDCQLVVLMVSRAINGTLVEGEVSYTDGR